MAASTSTLGFNSTAAVLKNFRRSSATKEISSSFLQKAYFCPSLNPHKQQPGAKGLQCRAYKVELEHKGQVHVLEVEEGETVLEKAIDADLDVPYDCKLGVCMTCPARLVSGTVDQSGGMLSDDVVEKGYTLLCIAEPQSDCRIKTIPEEELLSLQLVTAQH
ncbi:hypothetical protein KP509_24G055400 [Ceratopteris richardii]|uniref:Ferredoxin n=1 Tax=Ceratopteris richardii TaxID=49495 RepID=A0A8T2RV16_CERRI|nr:hypothetical protein KP509_24G055400 [Ceratopteris richardii]